MCTQHQQPGPDADQNPERYGRVYLLAASQNLKTRTPQCSGDSMKIKIELEIDTVKDQQEIQELLQIINTLKEKYDIIKRMQTQESD